MITRANGEITVTYEALKSALQLDDSMDIVGQATEPGDVRTGSIRLLVIDSKSLKVPEGAVSAVLKRIDSSDVDRRDRYESDTVENGYVIYRNGKLLNHWEVRDLLQGNSTTTTTYDIDRVKL